MNPSLKSYLPSFSRKITFDAQVPFNPLAKFFINAPNYWTLEPTIEVVKVVSLERRTMTYLPTNQERRSWSMVIAQISLVIPVIQAIGYLLFRCLNFYGSLLPSKAATSPEDYSFNIEKLSANLQSHPPSHLPNAAATPNRPELVKDSSLTKENEPSSPKNSDTPPSTPESFGSSSNLPDGETVVDKSQSSPSGTRPLSPESLNGENTDDYKSAIPTLGLPPVVDLSKTDRTTLLREMREEGSSSTPLRERQAQLSSTPYDMTVYTAYKTPLSSAENKTRTRELPEGLIPQKLFLDSEQANVRFPNQLSNQCQAGNTSSILSINLGNIKDQTSSSLVSSAPIARGPVSVVEKNAPIQEQIVNPSPPTPYKTPPSTPSPNTRKVSPEKVPESFFSGAPDFVVLPVIKNHNTGAKRTGKKLLSSTLRSNTKIQGTLSTGTPIDVTPVTPLNASRYQTPNLELGLGRRLPASPSPWQPKGCPRLEYKPLYAAQELSSYSESRMEIAYATFAHTSTNFDIKWDLSEIIAKQNFDKLEAAYQAGLILIEFFNGCVLDPGAEADLPLEDRPIGSAFTGDFLMWRYPPYHESKKVANIVNELMLPIKKIKGNPKWKEIKENCIDKSLVPLVKEAGRLIKSIKKERST